jgi:hypothetical protein
MSGSLPDPQGCPFIFFQNRRALQIVQYLNKFAYINFINPRSELWTLDYAAGCGELNHPFSSAHAEQKGGLKRKL